MAITDYIWDPVTDSYLMETDGTDTTQAVYTNEPVQFGRLISQRRDNATDFYHFDALGSTRELSDSSESVTDTYIYTAWGEEVTSTGTTEILFEFGGKFGYAFDSTVQQIQIRERYYNPYIGRWLTPDMLIQQRLQRPYTFVRNNPIGRVDPSGFASRPMRGDGEVPDYDKGAVSACQALLRTIVNDGTHVGKNYPCAQDLLRHFLSQRGGTHCPSSCKSAVKKEMLRHLSKDRNKNALVSELFSGCSKSTAKTWEEGNLFRGSGKFKQGDLFLGIHDFKFVFRGAAHLVCGAGTGNPCCCDCNGAATLEGSITDTYDFCDSLKGTAVPPWQEDGLIPGPDALAYCGCVLEDYYKKNKDLGIPIVGGNIFQVDCPMRLQFSLSGQFCEN